MALGPPVRKGGTFDWHRNRRYVGYLRVIISIGSKHKVMYFEEETLEKTMEVKKVVGIGAKTTQPSC
jgi:hypothetical protein